MGSFHGRINDAWRGSEQRAADAARLILTPIKPEDGNDLVLLYGDPQVAFWTGPWRRKSVEAWAQGMTVRWTADGVGKWMARDRVDGSVVGRGGFTRFNLDGESCSTLAGSSGMR